MESYTYDADGKRVKKTVGSTNFYYPFPTYEISGTVAIKYYYFNGQRVAMKSGSTLIYLHGDHLGSTALATKSDGTVNSSEQYFAYGKADRLGAGAALPTDNTYTGQKRDGSGLMYYQSRYYDPQIRLFVSPDTIVPDTGNVFGYKRSIYVLGRVMNANDPTGHAANDKAITAGDGAGTYSTVFFKYDSFVCSQDACLGGTGALDQDIAGLLLLKEMTSHNKDVAMAMAFMGGGEVVGEVGVSPGLIEAANSEALAAQAKTPAGIRPAAAGALEVNGKIYTAQSVKGGTPPTLNQQVQEALDNIPLDQRSVMHGFCVEPQCISQAIDDGLNPEGGTSYVVKVRAPGNPAHGALKAACPSCAALLEYFGIIDGAQ